MKSSARSKLVSKLKRGDRFSFIPADWYGPAVIREVYRTGNDDSGKPLFCLKYDNDKITNPPGVSYLADERVRLMPLKRKR